jgi:hypothetical protein
MTNTTSTLKSLALLKRSTQRITVTVSNAVYVSLNALSLEQGRSTSNLAAYLVERALDHKKQQPVQNRLTQTPDRSSFYR